MGFSDFWINNNGKKEHLNNTKHGVRKEQVDEKFHNLFDVYDTNGDGTLENEELGGVFKGLTKFAGADKTLDSAENKQVASLFENQVGIKDVDFMGFVRSVSQASENIVDLKETPTADGGREVTTTYKDGSVETISYYPDGEYKFKKLDQKVSSSTNYYTIGENLDMHYTSDEIESRVKEAYQQKVAQIKASAEKNKSVEGSSISFIPNYDEFKKGYLRHQNINHNSDTHNYEMDDFELSERGKRDVAVRDFVLSHYIDTHKSAQEALESMGILDKAGAAINAGGGELWNSIKNVWNGTDEEYQNFYELSKKFEPNYNKALRIDGSLDVMRNNPEMFFRGFETDYKKDTGHKFDLQPAIEFQETTERYENATILNQRLGILNDAMSEIRMYENEQNALTYAPAQSEGINPASHILKANNLLLQYFDGDKEAVNMLLNGTIGNAESTISAIKGIADDTQKMFDTVTNGKSFDEIKKDYQTQYKDIYGTDFVPDELTEKVMDAKATGGMIKLAAITAISILITKSPLIAELSASAGGAEVTGAAANMIRTLATKYGPEVVQQGIKFAMTSGTLAADVGLTLLNQAASERGINGEELLESAKGSAKYIYFGAYIGAPLAQAVSKQLGKIGATARMFDSVVKSASGAIQTTSITGDKLVQNLMKGGNKVLATGGAFLTDAAAFSGLEAATEGINPLTAGKEQNEMLGKLKIMNHFIEYMLGGKVHAGMTQAKMDAAIEKSGVKNWQIKEIKSPNKTVYEVEVGEGLPKVRFEDKTQLTTAMLEKVSANYTGAINTKAIETNSEQEVKAEIKHEAKTEVKAETEVKPETEVNAENTAKEPVKLKSLTDAEFVELKSKIERNPIFRRKFGNVELSKENIQLADIILSNEKLYNNENVMQNIGDIIFITNTPERAEIAKTILSNEKYYNNKNVMQHIEDIIFDTKSENLPLAKQIFQTEGLNPEKASEILKSVVIQDGINDGNIDTQKVKQYTNILQDKKLSPFVIENLHNGMDMNTVAFLSKTQKKLNAENSPQNPKSQLDENLQVTHDIFTSHGMNDKEADAILKAISQDGTTDVTLQSVALDLLSKGIPANKIGDAIKNAKITGEFNPKIIDDFVLLQNLGLNPLLEKNLAVLNNITGADTAVKFNSNAKKSIKAMLGKLTPEQSQALAERGFDINAINKKLDTKIVKTSENIPQKTKVISGLRTKQSITGFEKIVIDKYNPTEQIWRSEAETKKWVQEKYESILNGDYKSRTYEQANEPRQKGLKEWTDFMANEPELKDNPFAKIILAEFITKDLLPENADIPPQLDKALVKEILLSADKNINFSKQYADRLREKAMQNSMAEKVEVNGVKGTWYTVPQTDKSSADYKTNVDKVKAFSDGTNSCIRTYNAEPYVEKGAMHFFVDENGLTQVCIRETSPGSVYEIQKRQQNATVPIAHIDVIDDYMKRNQLTAQSDCKSKIETAKQAKPQFDKLKTEFSELVKKQDYKAILEKIGITVEENPDGTLILSHYDPEIDEFTLSDLGIKENDLLANVVKIEGDAEFKNSNATTAPRLQEVGGKLDFEDSSLSDVRALKSINGRQIDWKVPELPLNTNVKFMVLKSGDKFYLKPELKKQIENIAEQIRELALTKEDDIVKYMKQYGFEVSDSQMTHRAKGFQSLYDKLKNYLIDKDNADKTLNDAIKSVKDAVGTRTILENKDYSKHPEVVALLNSGKKHEAVMRAAELQSQEMFQKLKVFLINQKENNTNIDAIRINNYMAKDGVPYLSERQLAELQDLGVVSIKSRVTTNDEKAELIDFNNKDATTKVRDSGYTAFQMNFTTKDGFVYEWQFRGEEVNRFAEGEHIPYDLRTNKDIIGDNKNLKLLYEPVKKLLDKNIMGDDVYNQYNQYLTDHYNYLRAKELGFDAEKPLIENYGNGFVFDKRLKAGNLEKLHEIAEKLKKDKISQEEALAEYFRSID